MRQVKLSFLPVPPCPCLVCVLSLKRHNVNVKKTDFGEWGGGVNLDALCTQLPSPLHLLLVLQAGEFPTGWDRSPLLWLSVYFMLFDAGVALKKQAVKDKPPFVIEKKKKKKRKKTPVFYLCAPLNCQRSYCEEREQVGFYLSASARQPHEHQSSWGPAGRGVT